MLTYPELVTTVRAAVSRFQQHWLNQEQDQAVSAPLTPPTFIVAGPGAGKTTVLVLRVLKLILVDQIPPDGVMATTFTRKAAGELRSRILSWGYATVNRAIQDAQNAGDAAREQWLRNIDVNAIMVGTLDSLAEEFLRDCRAPAEITPTTIEGFLAKGLMRRHAIFAHGRHQNADLRNHVIGLSPGLNNPIPLSEVLRFVMAFAGRVRHDGVNALAYAAGGPGQQVLCDAIADYNTYLEDHYLADFSRLEQLIFDRLGTGQLAPVTSRLRALLVDEFQDTNYQQEQIYLRLCQQSNASLTVVGDDDQSIFRFRGATVEIFANFEARIVQALGAAWQPNRVDLFRNYRSTRRVVDFCQHFIQIDPGFQAARAPGKLPLVAQASHANLPNRNLPILGMFRTDCQTLADDLAQLLCDVFQGAGRQIQCAGASYTIARANGGNFGDSVLLAHSVRERTASGRDRLPLFLRQRLQAQGVRVFNPRGRSLGDIDDVQRLLGLALHCIDNNGAVMGAIPNLPQASRNRLLAWRLAAQQFMATNPGPGGLAAFVQAWRTRTSGFANQNWPREWPLLELVFTLATWFPSLQADPEGQVYLEAIARTLSEVGQMASYQRITLELAEEFLRLHKAQRCRFVPVGIAQGWSPGSYAAAVSELQKLGYRYIALGGMVPLKTHEIVSCLKSVAAIRLPETQLHLLGVTRIEQIPEFRTLGVVSFDSTSPLRQAFKDDKDNYYTMDRTYCAIRVPQVEANPKMRGRIVAGEVSQAQARKLEQGCLEALELFDQGKAAAREVLQLLREYEKVHDGRIDRSKVYEEILEDKPWKECPCEICRKLGIHVILFRGAERNRRRGFHNLFVFSRRLHRETGQPSGPPRE